MTENEVNIKKFSKLFTKHTGYSVIGHSQTGLLVRKEVGKNSLYLSSEEIEIFNKLFEKISAVKK